MSLQRAQQPTPAHWSKDFVEHLRTVHLTLIVTAVALVIVAITTKPYSGAVARNELHRILELKGDWTPDTLFPLSNLVVKNAQPRRYFEDIAYKPPLALTAASGYYQVVIPKSGEAKRYSVKLTLPSQWYFSKDGSELPQIPETISNFKKWWDALDSRTVTLIVPTRIIGVVRVQHEKRPQLEEVALLVPHSPGQSDSPPIEIDTKLGFTQKHPEEYQLIGRVPTHGEEDALLLSLPIESETLIINRNSVAHFLKVPPEDFDHAFLDLRQVANTNGIETFSKLDEVLSKSELADAPVFEAFGVKFPADTATFGGIVVLLCVQLYFFVYLRRLSGNLKADDSGWDVPWIGMDTSTLAKIIFFITVTLVPCFGILIIGGQTVIRMARVQDILFWSVSNNLRGIGLLAAFLLSGLLGWLCWKYRPQLTPQTPEEEPECSTFGE